MNHSQQSSIQYRLSAIASAAVGESSIEQRIMQNKDNFQKAKMNANAFSQKDYENETTHRPKKTNPNKPNFTYHQRGKTEVLCRFSEVRYLSSALEFTPGAVFSVSLPGVFYPWPQNVQQFFLNKAGYS